jgi:hypothetical protein
MVINNEIETYLVPPERRLNQVCQFSVPNTCLFCIIISFKLVYIYIYHVFKRFRGANKNGSVSTHHHHQFWVLSWHIGISLFPNYTHLYGKEWLSNMKEISFCLQTTGKFTLSELMPIYQFLKY